MINNENSKSVAWKLLEAGLQELTDQLEPGDYQKIANEAKLSKRTVELYTKDKNIFKAGTGRKILAAGRKIVIARTNAFIEQETRKTA